MNTECLMMTLAFRWEEWGHEVVGNMDYLRADRCGSSMFSCMEALQPCGKRMKRMYHANKFERWLMIYLGLPTTILMRFYNLGLLNLNRFHHICNPPKWLVNDASPVCCIWMLPILPSEPVSMVSDTCSLPPSVMPSVSTLYVWRDLETSSLKDV